MFRAMKSTLCGSRKGGESEANQPAIARWRASLVATEGSDKKKKDFLDTRGYQRIVDGKVVVTEERTCGGMSNALQKAMSARASADFLAKHRAVSTLAERILRQPVATVAQMEYTLLLDRSFLPDMSPDDSFTSVKALFQLAKKKGVQVPDSLVGQLAEHCLRDVEATLFCATKRGGSFASYPRSFGLAQRLKLLGPPAFTDVHRMATYERDAFCKLFPGYTKAFDQVARAAAGRCADEFTELGNEAMVAFLHSYLRSFQKA